MADMILKKEYLDEIKRNPGLFGDVMQCLGKKPSYGLQLLKGNNVKLTQASVLQILKDYFGVAQYSDLLEEAPEKINKPQTTAAA